MEALEASGCARGPRQVPYARRGHSLKQLKAVERGLRDTGWLQARCDEFNHEHAEEIRNGKKNKMEPNLYAIDRFLVKPTTSAGANAREGIPEAVLQDAEIPAKPAADCCFSQLLNPDGLEVDYFVSHWWGHPFERTVQALSNFAETVYKDLGKNSPDDVVFWICLFALNQHQAEEEVGSTPEEGPFNAALAKARHGAVMVLDGRAEPLQRI